MNLLVTGSSGSGTTTLGQDLSRRLQLSHLDSDAYFWLPTPVPFQKSRDPASRLAALLADIRGASGSVVSGSVVGWGTDVEDAFDLIVFLYVPTQIRLQRITNRELSLRGSVNPDFLRWAAQYDAGPPRGRSLARHGHWLAQRRCPVLRLQGDQAVARLAQTVLQVLAELSGKRTVNDPANVPRAAGGDRLF